MTNYSASALRSVRLGAQSVFGTSVTPNLRPAFGLDADPQLPVFEINPSGTKFPFGVMVGKEMTRLALSNSQATFNDLVLYLHSLMGKGTLSGNTWEFLPESFEPDDVQFYTVDIGDGFLNGRIPNCFADTLTLTFAPTAAIGMTGEMTGGIMDESSIVLNPSPTLVPVVPLQPKGTDTFFATTLAGLDTATRLADLSTTWSYTNARNPIMANDTSEPSYSGIVDIKPGLRASLVIPHSAAAIGYLQDARRAGDFFLRIRNTGATIGGVTYKIEIDMAVNHNDNPGARGDNQGAYSSTFPLIGRHDETLGSAVRVRITTAIASNSTFVPAAPVTPPDNSGPGSAFEGITDQESP